MSTATPASNPAVAVILVNWNGWQHVIECLDSLLAQDHPEFHVFVVDNDSSDGSTEHISAWCAKPVRPANWHELEGVTSWNQSRPGRSIPCQVLESPDAASGVKFDACAVTVVRSGGNPGFAGGCNVGLRIALRAGFPLFWLLNTDTVVHRRALAELIQRLRTDPGAGMIGSTIRYYTRPDVIEALCGARLNPDMNSRLIGLGSPLASVPVDSRGVENTMTYITGASMLVTDHFLQDVGLMQEDYFLYGEEIDWTMRAGGRFRLLYAPGSHVFHKSGASSSKLMPLFSAGFYYRNRIRLVGRFFPERMGAAKRGLVVELARHAARQRWGYARIVVSTLWDAGKLAAEARQPPAIQR